jgi:mannose-6-phosphate isomerase-like protein (cupin superfamily)
MNKQGKVWGSTSCLFCKNNVEFHRIEGKKDGFSSKHKHLHKYNSFFVESGSIKIKIWKDYGLVDETILEAGDSCEVAPCQYHAFEVLKDCVAYEMYWVEINQKDIEREGHGGEASEK